MTTLLMSKPLHGRLATMLVVFFAFFLVLLAGMMLGVPLRAYGSEVLLKNTATLPTAIKHNAIVSNVASAYSPQALAGMTSALNNQIRTIMGEASYLSLPNFSSGYKDKEMRYPNIAEPCWNYYWGGFGGNEKKTTHEDSAADYTAKQAGSYIMASRYLPKNLLAGMFYSFRGRDVEHNLVNNQERQLFHSVGGFLGYRQEGWYIFNTIAYTAGFHSAVMTTDVGSQAKADYNSQNVRNSLLWGAVFDGLFRIIPEVGLVYDHIAGDSYKDSSNGQYTGISKNIFHSSLGLRIIDNYKIMDMDIEPQLAVNFIKSIGSRDIQAYRQDNLIIDGTSIVDRTEKNYLVLEAGFNTAITATMDLRLGYTGTLSPSAQSNSLALDLLFRDLNTKLSATYNTNTADNYQGFAYGGDASICLGVKIGF